MADQPKHQRAPVQDRLMAEGARLFAQKGFGSVSVREICTAAKTSINMIHHYFGTKDGLRDALIARYGDAVYSVPLRLLATPASSAQDLTARIGLIFETTLEACLAERDILMVVLQNQAEVPPLVSFQTAFIAFLEQAKRDCYVRADVDSAMISGAILDRVINQTQFAPWMKQTYDIDVAGDAEYRRTWCAANVDLFLNGLLKAGPGATSDDP